MKLSNTHKHIWFGMLAAFVLSPLACYAQDPIRIAGLFTILWLGITCGWEYYQYLKHGSKRNYWTYRGKDTIVDLLAGNLPFNLIMWLWVVNYVRA